jgi:hypothetical protein
MMEETPKKQPVYNILCILIPRQARITHVSNAKYALFYGQRNLERNLARVNVNFALALLLI